MNKITYENGWCGGEFFIDGKPFSNINKKPKALLYIEGEPHDIKYQVRSGTDEDHGHNYSWTMIDVGIMDGVIEKRFLSIRRLQNRKIYIDFL
jgi:hypothetical protein